MSRSIYARVLSEFKARENPEAVLLVGENSCMTHLCLAWPNVSLTQHEPAEDYSKQWNEVEKWEWLWKHVRFSKKDIHTVMGRTRIDTQLRCLIANRILYPDGTVHSYVIRYLRSRVVKLFEKRPNTRRDSMKVALD